MRKSLAILLLCSLGLNLTACGFMLGKEPAPYEYEKKYHAEKYLFHDSQGEDTRALADAQALLEIYEKLEPDAEGKSPGTIQSLSRVSHSLAKLGRFADALPYMERERRLREATEVLDADTRALHASQIAHVAFAAGNPEKAVLNYEQALSIWKTSPADPAVIDNTRLFLTRAYLAAGKPEKAAEQIRVTLDKGDPPLEWLFVMGDTSAARNDHRNADYYYQLAHTLGSHRPDLDSVRFSKLFRAAAAYYRSQENVKEAEKFEAFAASLESEAQG